MRIIRRHQLGAPNCSNFYHVVSRTTGREILFNNGEKEAFTELLRRQLAFSGLNAIAWCLMGNHFHLLLEVPDRAASLSQLTDEECFARLKFLGDEFSTRCLESQIIICRGNGDTQGLRRIADGIRARIFDLSAFMKELKLKMTGWYNLRHGRHGTLWEGRFRSVLVEDGRALRLVAAYIDLNPLRARLVSDPMNYRWCSYAAAVAGDSNAQRGITRAVSAGDAHSDCLNWNAAIAQYRLLIYGMGAEREADEPMGAGGRGGFSQEEIRRVIAEGGRLPVNVALRMRYRFMTYGLIIGSEEFVETFFADRGGALGRRRRNHPPDFHGNGFDELRTLDIPMV